MSFKQQTEEFNPSHGYTMNKNPLESTARQTLLDISRWNINELQPTSHKCLIHGISLNVFINEWQICQDLTSTCIEPDIQKLIRS